MDELEKQIEKQKKEEKETERKMIADIRDLKIRRSLKRKDQIGEMNLPARKKRRKDH